MPEPKKERNLTVEQALTEQDFREAYLAMRNIAYPKRRRGIQAGLCLTAAGLAATMIPLSQSQLHTAAPPCAVAGVFLLLAAAVWFFQPVLRGRRAGRIFRSNRLMPLKTQMTLLHDRVLQKSRYERSERYWTEFSFCASTPRLFVAMGGIGRNLWILRKEGLSEEKKEEAEKILSAAFGRRYYRMDGKRR